MIPTGTIYITSIIQINDDRSLQLAQALAKTGVFSVKNPCFIGGFYAGSAAGAVAASDIAATATSGEVFGETADTLNAMQTAYNSTKTAQVLSKTKVWLGAFGLYEIVSGNVQKAWNWATNEINQGCQAAQTW
jgi:hypothetical protein